MILESARNDSFRGLGGLLAREPLKFFAVALAAVQIYLYKINRIPFHSCFADSFFFHEQREAVGKYIFWLFLCKKKEKKKESNSQVIKPHSFQTMSKKQNPIMVISLWCISFQVPVQSLWCSFSSFTV